MKTNNKKVWKNKAYNDISVLDDDGNISDEDLIKIRGFIDEYSKNAEVINPVKKIKY